MAGKTCFEVISCKLGIYYTISFIWNIIQNLFLLSHFVTFHVALQVAKWESNRYWQMSTESCYNMDNRWIFSAVQSAERCAAEETQ